MLRVGSLLPSSPFIDIQKLLLATIALKPLCGLHLSAFVALNQISVTSGATDLAGIGGLE